MTCQKCQGLGVLSQYMHVSSGLCFACDGTGKVDEPIPVKKKESVREEYRGSFPLEALCQGLSEEEQSWLVVCSLPEESLPAGLFPQWYGSSRAEVRYVVGYVCGQGHIEPIRIDGITLTSPNEVLVTHWN